MKNIYHIATIADLVSIIDITGLKYILDENYIEIEKDDKVYLCPVVPNISHGSLKATDDFKPLYPLAYHNGRIIEDHSISLGLVGPARIARINEGKGSFSTGFASTDWLFGKEKIHAYIKTYPTGRVVNENGHRMVYTRITV